MTTITCPRLGCEANEDGKCTESVITLMHVNADPDDRHAPNDWLICNNFDREVDAWPTPKPTN